MNRYHLLLTLLFLAPLLSSCAIAPKTVARQDPLIGKIIDARESRPVSFSELMDRVAEADVIYLSEKHDNAMQHAIQRRIVQELIDRGKPPRIGFEFFAMNDTPLILNFIDSGKKDHPPKIQAMIEADLRKRLDWDDQSDTMWGYYWDLLTLARDNGLVAAGLDLSTSAKRRITRKGVSDLTDLEKKQLFSTGLENPVYEAHMKSIFKAVHCGMSHGNMSDKLYAAWLARNDKMALSVTQVADGSDVPVVVIVGNGHTEFGLGVVDRVTAITPGLSQINVALTEIMREPADLDQYLEPLDLEGFEPAPPADYIWFTQRVSYTDPCERFKKSLEKMKAAKE